MAKFAGLRKRSFSDRSSKGSDRRSDDRSSRGGRFSDKRSNEGRSSGKRFGDRRFDNSSSRGFNRKFDDRKPRRDRSERSRDSIVRTKVKCSDCGQSCEVPFKPTSDKPVYCDSCFENKGKPGSKLSKDDLQEINEKLDKIMRALSIN